MLRTCCSAVVLLFATLATVATFDMQASAQERRGGNDTRAIEIDESPTSRASAVCTSVGQASVVLNTVPLSQKECDALEAFFISTNGPTTWDPVTGWFDINDPSATTDPCDWSGVNCLATEGLYRINLASRGLTGSLPAEIGDLVNLRELQLYGNSIGGALPTQLGDTPLTLLNLGFNQLTGGVPVSIFDTIVTVELAGNQLTGPLPAPQSAPHLKNLGMSSNGFSGPIPAGLISPSLTTLQLGVANNAGQLTGSLPDELAQATDLSWLDVRGHQLDGPVPAWLGSMSNLLVLDIGANNFYGYLPDNLVNLPHLNTMWAPSNGCIASSDAVATKFGFVADQAACAAFDGNDAYDTEAGTQLQMNVLQNDVFGWNGSVSLVPGSVAGAGTVTVGGSSNHVDYAPPGKIKMHTPKVTFTYEACAGGGAGYACIQPDVEITITPVVPPCNHHGCVPTLQDELILVP